MLIAFIFNNHVLLLVETLFVVKSNGKMTMLTIGINYIYNIWLNYIISMRTNLILMCYFQTFKNYFLTFLQFNSKFTLYKMEFSREQEKANLLEYLQNYVWKLNFKLISG